MMRLRIAVVALAALGGVAFSSTAAPAMPNGVPNANEIVGQTSDIQQARWVCPRGAAASGAQGGLWHGRPKAVGMAPPLAWLVKGSEPGKPQ
jgi:hypothetical protein